MSKYFLLTCVFTILTSSLLAQTNKQQELGFEYYQNGEFQKAADVFQELYKNNPSSTINYNYLYNALIQIKDFSAAEKLVKKTIRKFPQRQKLYVDLGMVYQQDGDLEKGNKTFKEAIEDLPAENNLIVDLAEAFAYYNKWEKAIDVYLKGRSLLNSDRYYNLELAAAYEKNGDAKEGVPYYLDYLKFNPSSRELIESKLLAQVDQSEEYSEALQKELLSRVQGSGVSIIYSELLIWFYTQEGNFTAAFIQARALDKRNNEQGGRIMDLARNALEQEAYDAAIKGYEYVIDKGQSSRYYLAARQEMLEARQEKITSGKFTEEDLEELDQAYDQFLDQFGLNANTAKTLRQKARLHALYMNDYNGAIKMLEDLINSPRVSPLLVAESKLDLGDYYLMNEEIWEATLLYSQVDKAMKDEPLGEMARFKNALLSYYTGDFEWSQTQLSVLKASTSELISNDAIELSVFIMDNMGLDTTKHPMELFARADLLHYQNKDEKAMQLLDSITYFYPDHALKDDILFKKGEIKVENRNFEQAKNYYEKVLEKAEEEDLLIDNALFKLAGLYENELGDPEKAMEYYQKIILEFRESIFLNEARKRYRKLRGDQL